MAAPRTKATKARPHPKKGRAGRGFVQARQFELDLEPAGTLAQRIQWSKETSARYEELAARERDPQLRARFERRAATWDKHVLDLIDERKRTEDQLSLFTNL